MKRIEWLDSARGIAILIVMIFHAFDASSGIVPEINNRSDSFMIPIFFVISGFLFRERHVREFIVNRARRILLPYFIAQIVSTILLFIVSPDTLDRWEKYVLGIFYADFMSPEIAQLANEPLWFLPTLFVAELIFLLIPKKFIAILISMLGLFCPIKLPWGIDIAMTSQIFLLAGFWLRNHQISNLLLIFIALIFFPTVELNYSIGVAFRIYNNPILFFIDGIAGSILIFKLSQLISNRFLNFIGQKTLDILMVHGPILYVLENFISDPSITINCWINFFLTLTIILIFEKRRIARH